MKAFDLLEALSDMIALQIVQSLSVEPGTIPQLSRRLDIPMTGCYRRVTSLTSKGLIQETGSNPGANKKSIIYTTNILKLDISFGSGKLFAIIYYKDGTRQGRVLDLGSEPFEEQIVPEDQMHGMIREMKALGKKDNISTP